MSNIIQLSSGPIADRGTPVLEAGDPSIRTDAVYVIFTSIDETLAAVRVAGTFAKPLGAPVTVVHLRTVPYALPVEAPCGVSPVEAADFVRCLETAGEDVRVRVCLCRDERQAISAAIARHSLVVIAGRRRWWPTEAGRLRGALEAAGHFVVFVDPSTRKETTHA